MRVFFFYQRLMLPVRRQISPHAARLRRDATEIEKLIWARLRNRQLGGFKCRRQWTIGPYVADFACLEAMVIVELDGGQHSIEADAVRTRALEAAGFAVVRFWNNEVFENLDGVLEAILGVLVDRSKR